MSASSYTISIKAHHNLHCHYSSNTNVYSSTPEGSIFSACLKLLLSPTADYRSSSAQAIAAPIAWVRRTREAMHRCL